jgi:hypothetical protein
MGWTCSTDGETMNGDCPRSYSGETTFKIHVNLSNIRTELYRNEINVVKGLGTNISVF